jgi:hypothetical protein
MDDGRNLISAHMRVAADAQAKSMRDGIAASLALHIVAILLITLGLPQRKPPPVEAIIPVNLVQLGEKTASPTADIVAPLPQQQAPETAMSQPAEAVPAPQTPAPPTPSQVPARSGAEFPTAEPTQNLDAPRPAKPLTKPQRPPSPADTLAARLKALAQLRQPPSPTRPTPRQQDGRGESSVTAANMSGRAADATYAVKDLIRAQVERRWNLDKSAATAKNWTVSIRIRLDAQGRVLAAEIVDDPHLSDDEAYRDFALSARNAVLLSSPLLLPPNVYDIAKNIVVDFDSRQVLQ